MSCESRALLGIEQNGVRRIYFNSSTAVNRNIIFFICNAEKFCGIGRMPLATLVKCHDCGRMGSAFFSASFTEKSKLKLLY